MRERPQLTLLNVAHNLLMYAVLNQRSPADSAQPHPALRDRRVREALRLALDRQTMARGVFGPATGVPDAAQSQLWSWVTGGALQGVTRNLPRARALLGRPAGATPTATASSSATVSRSDCNDLPQH